MTRPSYCIKVRRGAILAGHRILEVFRLGYWFPRLEDPAKQDLIDEIIALMCEGVLVTSAALKFSLDEIDAAVRQAESKVR